MMYSGANCLESGLGHIRHPYGWNGWLRTVDGWWVRASCTRLDGRLDNNNGGVLIAQWGRFFFKFEELETDEKKNVYLCNIRHFRLRIGGMDSCTVKDCQRHEPIGG